LNLFSAFGLQLLFSKYLQNNGEIWAKLLALFCLLLLIPVLYVFIERVVLWSGESFKESLALHAGAVEKTTGSVLNQETIRTSKGSTCLKIHYRYDDGRGGLSDSKLVSVATDCISLGRKDTDPANYLREHPEYAVGHPLDVYRSRHFSSLAVLKVAPLSVSSVFIFGVIFTASALIVLLYIYVFLFVVFAFIKTVK
jgi:hypothetical protein